MLGSRNVIGMRRAIQSVAGVGLLCLLAAALLSACDDEPVPTTTAQPTNTPTPPVTATPTPSAHTPTPTPTLTATPAPDPISFVPADAQTVMQVDTLQVSIEESQQDFSPFFLIRGLLLSIWLLGMLEDGEPYLPITDALVAMGQSDTENDRQSASKAVMFSDLELLSHSGFENDDGAVRSAYIATGRFDSSDFYRSMKEASSVSLEEIEYKGVNLLNDPEADFSSGIIEDEVLVFGTRSLVQAAIDVSAGERPSLTGQLLDVYDSLGEPSISLAMMVPGGEQDHVLDFLESAVGTERRLAHLGAWYEVLGVGVSQVGNIISAIVVLEHSDAESADSYAELVDGLMEQVDITDSEGEPLDILKVSTAGPRVVFNLEVTDEQLDSAWQWVIRDWLMGY